MSRSTRKPYYTWTSARNSAHADKTQAARGVRRAQEQAIRDCKDWEELVLPQRRECRWNNVYQWKRDGRQRPHRRDHNDFNPFWLTHYGTKNEAELIVEMLERIERWEWFDAYLRRK